MAAQKQDDQLLCEDTGYCPEDLPRAMNDREEWRERVRDIRATSVIWWWWWWCIWILQDLFSYLKYWGLLCLIENKMTNNLVTMKWQKKNLPKINKCYFYYLCLFIIIFFLFKKSVEIIFQSQPLYLIFWNHFKISHSVSWGCRTHCISAKELDKFSGYGTKLHLKLWGMRSTPSMSSVPGLLWP